MSDVWAVHALRLGSVDRDAADNFLDPRGRSGPMRLDFTMWTLTSAHGTVVFDTGFDPAAGERRGRVLERRPRDAVRLVGVDPDAVGSVVLSHLHYDHAGNLGDFPGATVVVQAAELGHVAGPDMLDAHHRHFIEVDDVVGVVRRLHGESLRLVEGDVELFPGLELYRIGGHTPGLQVVRVRTERGWIVLAADGAHYLANLRERNPFPAVVDVPQMLAGFDRIEELADSPEHVVPGHDPQVFADYADPAGADPSAALPEGVVALHHPPRAAGADRED